MLRSLLLCVAILSSIAQADIPAPPYRRVESLKVSEYVYNDIYAVDGNRAYVASREQLVCVDLETMKRLWAVPVAGRELVGCIAAYRGVVYVTTSAGWSDKRSHLVALDEATGALLWTFEREGDSTGMVFEDNRVYLVRLIGTLSCVDLRTRQVLWDARIPGDTPEIDEGKLWLTDSSVIVHYDETTTCVDKSTGRVRWREAPSYLFEGSVVAAAGIVWMPTNDGGSVDGSSTAGRSGRVGCHRVISLA